VNPDYLSKPIIPTKGLAGIELGVPKSRIETEFGAPLRRRVCPEPDDRLEYLDYHGLSIVLTSGIVTVLAAEQGYLGTTPSGVQVGMPWKELKQIHPDISFYEEEYEWYVPGIDGLSFAIVRPPGPGDKNPSSKWVDEWHAIMDPWQAFVISIDVHGKKYGETT
jgi:hypothetical protein